MAKKEFRGPANNGKGNRPVMGYNPKKWNENFGEILWVDSPSKVVKKLRRNQNSRDIYVYENIT